MSYPSKPDEITVDWLTGVLGANPGDIESVAVEFVGDAIGNTSDVYFVKPALKPGVNLPNSLVAKMVPQFEGAIDVCKALQLFEREILVYRHIAGPSPLRTPHLYWSEFDPETSLGFMLLEDCSWAEGFDQTVPVPGTIEQPNRIVEASARFHAHWFGASPTPSGMLVPGDAVWTTFFTMIQGVWDGLLSGGPGAETIPDSGRAVATYYRDNLLKLTGEHWPTTNTTAMHLDFRLDNIFYDPGKNEPIVFDWQGASLGKGAWDIAYLLATGFAPEFRRKHERSLLERYHATLLAEGVSSYGLDEIQSDYRMGTALAMWVIPFTAILDLSSARGQALANKIIGGIFSAIEDHGGHEALREYLES